MLILHASLIRMKTIRFFLKIQARPKDYYPYHWNHPDNLCPYSQPLASLVCRKK